MSRPTPQVGTIAWFDLTIPNAEQVRDFYAAVTGWRPEPVDMGGYADFNMMREGSDMPVAGICHARGPNAALPPQWLLYIVVADLDVSVKQCIELGGRVVVQPKDAGPSGRYCVVRDPAGAHAALFETKG